MGSRGRSTGIFNYLSSLGSELVKRDQFEVGLVTSRDRTEFPEQMIDGLKFFRNEKLIRPRALDVAYQSWSMPRIAKSFKADAILSIDPVGAIRGGKVRLFVMHDLFSREIPQQYHPRERFLTHCITKMMLAGNDTVVCVSDATQKTLNRFYPGNEDKTYRIYSGAPQPVNGCVDGETDRKHLLWVSNVTANKNVGCLYRALEILAERGRKLSAVLVGNDPHGIELEARGLLRLTAPPSRLSNISQDELSQLYRSSLCFINTSLSEGFGLPVLEAQAHGAPVICPADGATAEVGGKESVLTFRQNSAEDLADQIVKLEDSPTIRHQLIDNGLENSRKFCWQKTAAEVESLVMDLLGRLG